MGLFRGAARHVAVVGALLAGLWGAAAFAGEKTVWLVRPLYPGQEGLIARIEQSLAQIIPDAQRPNEIIGVKELARLMALAKLDALPCLSGEDRCADPIDAFVAKLGVDRVVMVQGGQDESGFSFKVTSYKPGKGESQTASATNVILDRAFLGAIVKVVPLASTLEVTSTPSGAIVYVDDLKIGTTPLSTQVLPGDRAIRIDLKLHQPIEETVRIQARGTGKLERTLEKVAARILITAQPPGTSISIDGQVAGKDRIDRGIAPGRHTIRLTAENHKATEESIEIKPDQQYTMEKSLEPIPGAATDKPTQVVVVERQGVIDAARPPPPPPPPAPPPPPPTWTEQVYQRGNYFYLGFDMQNLLVEPVTTSDGVRHLTGLVARRWGTEGIGRTAFVDRNNVSLLGGSGEFGIMSKYFGIAVIGVSAHFATTPLGFVVGTDGSAIDATDPASVRFTEKRGLDAKVLSDFVIANMQLYTIRAIHPQLRIAAWRFSFHLSAGLEFRTGRVLEVDANADYKDGFQILDLLLGMRLGVRFYLVDGFFIHGTANWLQYLTGEQATVARPDLPLVDGKTARDVFHGPSGYGFNAGVGYGF